MLPPLYFLHLYIRKKSFPPGVSPFPQIGLLRSWRLERPVAVYCVQYAPFLLTLAALHPKPSPTAIHLQSVSPSPRMYSPHLGAIHLSTFCPVVLYNMCFPPNSRCCVSLSLYVCHPVFSSYCTLRVIFAPSGLFMVLLEIYFAFFFLCFNTNLNIPPHCPPLLPFHLGNYSRRLLLHWIAYHSCQFVFQHIVDVVARCQVDVAIHNPLRIFFPCGVRFFGYKMRSPSIFPALMTAFISPVVGITTLTIFDAFSSKPPFAGVVRSTYASQ